MCGAWFLGPCQIVTQFFEVWSENKVVLVKKILRAAGHEQFRFGDARRGRFFGQGKQVVITAHVLINRAKDHFTFRQALGVFIRDKPGEIRDTGKAGGRGKFVRAAQTEFERAITAHR